MRIKSNFLPVVLMVVGILVAVASIIIMPDLSVGKGADAAESFLSFFVSVGFFVLGVIVFFMGACFYKC